MGQKRSKNQIRRERQKLRKLEQTDEKFLEKSNPKVESVKEEPEIGDALGKDKTEKNKEKNQKRISEEDSKGNGKPDENSGTKNDVVSHSQTASEGPKDTASSKSEPELKPLDGPTEPTTNSSSIHLNRENVYSEHSSPDKGDTDASLDTKITEQREELRDSSQKSLQKDEKDEKGETEVSNKEKVMDIFSRLKDTSETPQDTDSDLFSQYSSVFHKFEPKTETHNHVVPYTASENETSESSSSESDFEEAEKRVSKRQKRLREKIPISVLKASTNKPQAVEWYDADAPDPFMVVHMKTTLNHVDVPSHWQQKKEYLSSKRGIERPPFELPKFIENTGISEMRNHDPESLKKSQRDRVQPKMGRLDIDYQKLHDAFFKHQTKPRMLAFGDVYSEGREKADQHRNDVSRMRPGKISKALRLAVGMSENEKAVPPWVTVMKELGKPPSYVNLLIPGIDIEYTNSGYQVQYGEKGSSLGLGGETWGALEDGEESEAESESETENEDETEEGVGEASEKVTGESDLANEAISKSPDSEDQPARVEISEYSKHKIASTAVAATSGSLYTVLKEKTPQGSDKQRYELDETEEKVAKTAKSAKEVKNIDETEDFRF